ncbi:hypothetical protein FGU65_12105 [Methanoculleus sp. FWC-SCC1]|uniref:ABM domain-containing protein n=1 Tax=Methanoculleus frigidifontis TaxID=2584085 RepID=A0ABT8MCN0_9EURY|nr:hypothetical protein [Methanoculleus sp. FWC-SCC1]MDN7025625.1 hypothetical protein [Methanoculleus sp. FWC-SCC1]
MTYLRVAVGWWRIDLNTAEGDAILAQVRDEGLCVLREQPGFIRYQLVLVDAHTTVAVVEWESEDLAREGVKNYHAWLKESGIAEKLMLDVTGGEVVAAS